jgi:hypothetical protein
MQSLNNLMINQKIYFFVYTYFTEYHMRKLTKKKLIFNYILQITTIYSSFIRIKTINLTAL